MESHEDKNWAAKYLLDPLNAPEPSQETGPGAHFTSSVNRTSPTAKTPNVTTTEKGSSVTTTEKGGPSVTTYPTPPQSASPTQSSFHPSNPYSPSHRQVAFGDHNEQRRSSTGEQDKGKGHRRNSSLGERFPGDMSHRPLDQIRKEAKAANRSPHLKKKHLPGADTIDSLDRSIIGGPYHHEGPYDATLLARNTSHTSSPVEAVRGSNAEAIRATPREYIKDSLNKHVPLQGTSVIPPGMQGFDGKTMNYEEGADLMREPDAAGGAYKRYADINYLPEDYKGKGEPSFSIERAVKEHDRSQAQNGVSAESHSYEMQPRSRPSAGRQRSMSGNHEDFRGVGRPSGSALRQTDLGNDMQRSNTTGRRIGEGLKKRFGSLRRGKGRSEA